MKQVFIISILSCLSLVGYGQTYKDVTASVEDRVNDLLSKMTLEEKIDYIGGYNDFYIRGIKRLDLPEIKLTDGPVGTHKDGKSTAYPAGTLSAATWDTSLVYELGKQLGRDSRARGVHILLAPGMNIIRSPLCGRNFEYFTEDPLLNSQISVAYVKGLQGQGVIATLKHYAANNQEWDRNNVSSDIDERVLHEIYLPAYKAAIQKAGAGAVMDGYNLINGVHATQHDYLNNYVLRTLWGFDGVVMSDWSATYDAVEAANGGLDLEMPRAKFMNKEHLLPAIESGKVKESTIDDKVKRILRLIFKNGFFENEQLDTSIPLNNPEGAKIALNLARGGIVLLKNENNLLPLKTSKVKTVAVIGPNANSYTSGGGSSYTFPFKSVSVLDGLRNSGNDVQISYISGVPTLPETVFNSVFYAEPGGKVKGLKGEYYNNIKLEGSPAITKIDSVVNIGNGWHIAAERKGIPYDHCSMRWTGFVKPEKTAKYRFVIRGFDGFRLKVDGKQVITEWRNQGITTREVVLSLKAGKEYPIELEYFAHVHPVDISFGWREDKLYFDEAAELAKNADVAIVNIGFNESSERESNDRPFQLPEYQDRLVESVVTANPNTVVLLNAGGNADMSKWIDKVPALLHIWYAGQEGGTAIAEILFGKTNPSGKLPMSFEKKWEDNPSYPYYYDTNNSKRVHYKEGLFMGYRHYDISDTKPRFPFGFGLSYTQFNYSDLNVSKLISQKGPQYKVSFVVKNTGEYDGAEAAQVYVRPIKPKVTRPYKELKGFSKHFIEKGSAQIFEILLDKEAFSYYKEELKDFDYDAGQYEIMVGSSSADIRLQKTIEIKK
ncbi:hypothetical protein D0T56_03520 [Dysgonomonas sp. 520]|nr:hypothetical protein [Dysgonomonas sp. 520]